MEQQNAKSGQPAAVWMPIGDLVPWEKNPRRNDDAVGKVAESIQRFGFSAPIVARQADRKVIAGHTRLRAAHKLGLHEVPVRLLDLSEADAQLLALADNRLGEIAEWDDEALARVRPTSGRRARTSRRRAFPRATSTGCWPS